MLQCYPYHAAIYLVDTDRRLYGFTAIRFWILLACIINLCFQMAKLLERVFHKGTT